MKYIYQKPQNYNAEQASNLDDKSKSQIKREMNYLQKIGERLISLTKEQLKKINLAENLFDAILLAKQIKSHEAIRRQKQYIGKLMRNLNEPEIQHILDFFDILDGKSKQQTQLLHFIEDWRTNLLQDDAAFTKFITEYPQVDTQILRTLIRNAKKEIEQNKPPKSYREIFAIIKNVVSQQT